jgi:hypothetical protein
VKRLEPPSGSAAARSPRLVSICTTLPTPSDDVTFATVMPILSPVETPEPLQEPTWDAPVEHESPPRRAVPSLWGLGERATWVSGLVLALSALTGWYAGSGEGVDVSVIGWHTGLLGKLVFFLGLAAVLVVALRRWGFELPAAVPESLVVIALGALSTIFVLVRAISIPDEFFFAGRGVGLWISLAASVALIGAGLLQASEEL